MMESQTDREGCGSKDELMKQRQLPKGTKKQCDCMGTETHKPLLSGGSCSFSADDNAICMSTAGLYPAQGTWALGALWFQGGGSGDRTQFPRDLRLGDTKWTREGV